MGALCRSVKYCKRIECVWYSTLATHDRLVRYEGGRQSKRKSILCNVHLACVAWRFVLVVRTNKLRQWNRKEIKVGPRAIAASPLSGTPDKTAIPRTLNATQKGPWCVLAMYILFQQSPISTFIYLKTRARQQTLCQQIFSVYNFCPCPLTYFKYLHK